MIIYENQQAYIQNDDGTRYQISLEKAGETEKRLRQNKINELMAKSKAFGVTALTDPVWAEFRTEIEDFQNNLNDNLISAIQNEDPTSTLSTTCLDVVVNPATGYTMRMSILEVLNK